MSQTLKTTIAEHGETLRPELVLRNPDAVPTAGKARKDAEENRRLAKLRLYDSDMVRAQVAWEFTSAWCLEELLNAHDPRVRGGCDVIVEFECNHSCDGSAPGGGPPHSAVK
jgi:hypothetical protein